MTMEECLAAWDYSEDLVREGQINKSSRKSMERWLQAPPGKVVRFAVRTMGEWWEGEPKNNGMEETVDDGSMGESGEVPPEEVKEAKQNDAGADPDYSVATKADDAKVDVSLWDRNVGIILGLVKITPALSKACDLVRESMFSWWRKKLTRECVKYLRERNWQRRDVDAGRECIT